MVLTHTRTRKNMSKMCTQIKKKLLILRIKKLNQMSRQKNIKNAKLRQNLFAYFVLERYEKN